MCLNEEISMGLASFLCVLGFEEEETVEHLLIYCRWLHLFCICHFLWLVLVGFNPPP